MGNISEIPASPQTSDPIAMGMLAALNRIEGLLAEQSAGALGRDAAARFLSVSVATLDRLTSAGKLKSVMVSVGRRAWRRADLEEYLNGLGD